MLLSFEDKVAIGKALVVALRRRNAKDPTSDLTEFDSWLEKLA